MGKYEDLIWESQRSEDRWNTINFCLMLAPTILVLCIVGLFVYKVIFK